MLQNIIKNILRNIFQNRLYSIVSISGLAIGLAVFILNILYTSDELSYDSHYNNTEQIYRIGTEGFVKNKSFKIIESSYQIANVLKAEIPEITKTVRLLKGSDRLIKLNNEKKFYETNIFYADSNVLDFFSIQLIRGDAKKALINPKTIIISESTAKKYFGKENPVGKTLLFDNDRDFEISGVFKDTPAKSHIHFNFIASLKTLSWVKDQSWLSQMFITYFYAKKSISIDELQKKINTLELKYISEPVKEALGISFEDWTKTGNYIKSVLIPIEKIYLHSDFEDEIEQVSNINYLYLFHAIAIFILIIVCINYMNLTTANSFSRNKEVAVRKIFGGNRKELILQFFTESVIVSFFALLLAMIIVEFALPTFNSISEKKLSLQYIRYWYLLPALICGSFIVGLFSGSFPAISLSSLKTISILKSEIRSSKLSYLLRHSSIVFQFTITLVFILFAFAISSQTNYIKTKPLGFSSEKIIIIKRAYILKDKFNKLKEVLLKNQNIIAACGTAFYPGINDLNLYSLRTTDSINPKSLTSKIFIADKDFPKTFGLEIIRGNFLNSETLSDSSAILINESSITLNALKSNPIGEKFWFDIKNNVSFKVKGVVKDFHYSSFKNKILPIILFPWNNKSYQYVAVKYSQNQKEALEYIQQVWNKLTDNEPFSYMLIEDVIKDMHYKESKTKKIIYIFLFIALSFAIVALFGLASFTCEQRNKEIAVRKTLGASEKDVIKLLSFDMLRWIALACIFAFPIAYLIISHWLSTYEYKTEIQISWFIYSFIIIGLISLITMAFHIFKSVKSNPAEVLRYE